MNIPTNLIDSYRNYFTEIGEAISSYKNDRDDVNTRMASILFKAMGLLGVMKGVAGVIGFVASLPVVTLWTTIALICSIALFLIGHDLAMLGKNVLEPEFDCDSKFMLVGFFGAGCSV